MRSNKEDNIPLVAVKPNKSNYLRTTSCFDEPEVSVIDWKFFISKKKRKKNWLISNENKNQNKISYYLLLS